MKLLRLSQQPHLQSLRRNPLRPPLLSHQNRLSQRLLHRKPLPCLPLRIQPNNLQRKRHLSRQSQTAVCLQKLRRQRKRKPPRLQRPVQSLKLPLEMQQILQLHLRLPPAATVPLPKRRRKRRKRKRSLSTRSRNTPTSISRSTKFPSIAFWE